MKGEHTIGNRLERLFRADPDVVRHGARVSVWGSWYIWLVGAAMLAHRPGLWFPDYLGFGVLNVLLAVVNGVVHHRLLTNRPVTWRWMLALSAIDVALITGNIAVSGRFDGFIFVAYYPALVMFAAVFSSLWLILAWVTATALVYCVVGVAAGPGLDRREALVRDDEQALTQAPDQSHRGAGYPVRPVWLPPDHCPAETRRMEREPQTGGAETSPVGL